MPQSTVEGEHFALHVHDMPSGDLLSVHVYKTDGQGRVLMDILKTWEEVYELYRLLGEVLATETNNTA